jgi:hypothetical protein
VHPDPMFSSAASRSVADRPMATDRAVAPLIAAAVVAMLLGGLTYILHRPDSLLMFRWFEAIGLDPLIRALRGSQLAGATPPSWWIASAPAALWLLSGLLALLAIWGREGLRHGWLWFAAVVAAAFAGELGQAVGVVPGVFDIADLVGSVLACAVAGGAVGLLIRRDHRHREEP